MAALPGELIMTQDKSPVSQTGYKLELLFPDGTPGFYVLRVNGEPQLWEAMALLQREGVTITSCKLLDAI